MTKPNPENCKNCSSKCAYDCAQLQYTTQHRTVLIISRLTLHSTQCLLSAPVVLLLTWKHLQLMTTSSWSHYHHYHHHHHLWHVLLTFHHHLHDQHHHRHHHRSPTHISGVSITNITFITINSPSWTCILSTWQQNHFFMKLQVPLKRTSWLTAHAQHQEPFHH